MKGYKGFEPGLICRGKQYAENTVFEEEEAEICSYGMHFCENPFDVLDYYGFINDTGDFNEFAEVEALDEVKTDNNRKFCTKKLKIGAKLSISKFINACVDFAIEKTSTCIADNKISSGDFAQIGSSGDFAQIGSSGDSAQIGSSGKDCVICCAGHNSAVKAKKGSWITLAEWEYSKEKERYIPKCVKTEFVDGERIKEDTLYKLIDGEFVEA
mgnify:CR=1 FL=1